MFTKVEQCGSIWNYISSYILHSFEIEEKLFAVLFTLKVKPIQQLNKFGW